MAATPAMLPLTPAAPLKAGEVVAPAPESVPEPDPDPDPEPEPEPEPEPPLVCDGRGVEEPTGVEWLPVGVTPGVVAPVVAEPEPVAVAVSVAEAEPESVAVAEAEPLSVAVAVESLPEEVVSMAGMEMGWPAAEHCETTTLETAVYGQYIYLHVECHV